MGQGTFVHTNVFATDSSRAHHVDNVSPLVNTLATTQLVRFFHAESLPGDTLVLVKSPSVVRLRCHCTNHS